MTNKEYVDGLRRVADFYEQHPDLAIPHTSDITVYSYNTKEEAIGVASVLGNCSKEFLGSGFYLIKDFGAIKLKFFFDRAQICKRVVVGTRVVPSVSYPERQEEIVEWECHSLLKP